MCSVVYESENWDLITSGPLRSMWKCILMKGERSNESDVLREVHYRLVSYISNSAFWDKKNKSFNKAVLFQTLLKNIVGLMMFFSWAHTCFFLLMHPFNSLTGKQIGSVWTPKCLWLYGYYVPLNQFEATPPWLCSVPLISLYCLSFNFLRYSGEECSFFVLLQEGTNVMLSILY